MPYIKQENRQKYEKTISDIKALLDANSTSGDLNYLISKIVHGFMETHGVNYENYNKVVGVLECAKLEFYRRKVAAYEEVKIVENGDV